jgi:hypothetical protein
MIDVPIQYQYEMETISGTTLSEIDSDILPKLEKVIVDSVLSEVFPDICPNVAFGKRRSLRNQRNLAVTGITMNPADLVNEECKLLVLLSEICVLIWIGNHFLTPNCLPPTLSIADICNADSMLYTDNRCDIVDGELLLFTDDGKANGVESRIQAIIRANMNNGVYAQMINEIVRLQYLDTAPSPEESNTEDNSGNGSTDGPNESNGKDLRVGLFVGLFAGAAIIAGVLYRTKRNMRGVDDETDIQTNNEAASAAPSQSYNEAGINTQSYDDSGMVMADTAMDSPSSGVAS